MGTHSGHDALIERIYDAIVDHEAYRDLSGEIATAVNAASTWLMLAEDDRPVVESAYNLDPSIFVDYEAYYHGCDPWWETRHRMGMDNAVAFERLVPTRTFSSSEFYNDFARPNGDRLHGLGAMTDIGGRIVALGLHRSRTGTPFDVADEQRIQALLPHLNRMMRSRAALARADRTLSLGDYAFRRLDDACLLCDARGRVLHGNHAAQSLPADLLSIGADGVIAMADPALGETLARALREVARRRVGASLLAGRAGRLPWRIAVDPTDRDEPAAIVTIIDLEAALRARLARAAARFGFTPSETALAESLMRGRSLDDHADLRGVRISTTRAQLRALLAKSGTARQSALVAAIDRC